LLCLLIINDINADTQQLMLMDKKYYNCALPANSITVKLIITKALSLVTSSVVQASRQLGISLGWSWASGGSSD
jgi:hypothetical protein